MTEKIATRDNKVSCFPHCSCRNTSAISETSRTSKRRFPREHLASSCSICRPHPNSPPMPRRPAEPVSRREGSRHITAARARFAAHYPLNVPAGTLGHGRAILPREPYRPNNVSLLVWAFRRQSKREANDIGLGLVGSTHLTSVPAGTLGTCFAHEFTCMHSTSSLN